MLSPIVGIINADRRSVENEPEWPDFSFSFFFFYFSFLLSLGSYARA
jgi:hypothetical protein